MRRLFYLAFLLCAYFWIITSGKDQLILRQGKAIYHFISKWIEDSDTDFQLKTYQPKKKSRRWD